MPLSFAASLNQTNPDIYGKVLRGVVGAWIVAALAFFHVIPISVAMLVLIAPMALMAVPATTFDWAHCFAVALVHAQLSVKDACARGGYNNPSDWSRMVKGETPVDLRRLLHLGPWFLIYLFAEVLKQAWLSEQEGVYPRDAALARVPRPTPVKVQQNQIGEHGMMKSSSGEAGGSGRNRYATSNCTYAVMGTPAKSER